MAGDANVPRLHLSLRRPLGSLSSPSSSSSEDSVELADDGSDAGDPRTTIVCLGRDHSVLFYDYHLVTVQHVSAGHGTVSVVDACTHGARSEVAVCRRTAELTSAVRRRFAVGRRTVFRGTTRCWHLQRTRKSVKRVLESVRVDVSATCDGQIDTGVRRETMMLMMRLK